jgi:hypothetical protein
MLSNTGLLLTLRSAYPREAFALQLTPLGLHFGSRNSKPKSLGGQTIIRGILMTGANPADTLLQIAGGYCLPRCLHVVANLGVADHLDESPRSAADLAAAVGVHSDALGRMLRLLSAHGVFETSGETFQHSAASRLLRTDHPQSMRALARMFGLPVNWAVFEALEYTLKTGRPAADKVLPNGFWGYFAEHPDDSGIFNAAMVGKAHGQIGAIVAAYDFSRFRLIGDIGGGRGHLLHAVLAATPTARGVLFDLPHVIEEATGAASDRLTLHAGDFFADPLPVCDAYLVMEVIHDWADEQSVDILRAIRKGAAPDARVLVIEQIIPNDAGPHWSKMLDIHMLAFLGGRQRTRRQYEALFNSAGLSLVREIDTGAGISILEAVAA